MADNGRPTAFVTGAAGFIGLQLVKVLLARGHRVLAQVSSLEGAQLVRETGARVVVGDLLEPGQWQDEASADWVFHVQRHPLEESRMTRRQAAAMGRARLQADAQLLDAVASSPARRVVYVADAGCYGKTGKRPITEDDPARPSDWNSCLAPALDRLEGYVAAGLPIVTALPGCVYGNGSWFRVRVMAPVLAGRRLLQFGRTGPWVSPIHLHDCARALVHLAEHGEVGGRYFLVNSEPIRLDGFANTFARLANRQLHVWRMPQPAARVALGSVLAGYIYSDGVFSNIRLRGTGFRFRYRTVEQGLRGLAGAGHE